MNPRLIFFSGPIKGTVFEVTEDEVSIGRDLSNQLSIMDNSLSRRHCLIRSEQGQFTILDHSSRNGTFVNEIPVQEQPLAHGDCVQIGNSFFFFLLDEDEQPAPQHAVRFSNDTLATSSTVVRPEDVLYSVAHDLDALMKVSQAIRSLRSLRPLQRQLLECVFAVVPAARGAIVLADDGPEEFSSVFVLHRRPGRPPHLPVSRTVARQVLMEKVAILSNDVTGQEALSKSESLITSRVKSLLCAPFVVGERAVGFIYLDTEDEAMAFTGWHLQMVTAISEFTAGALDSARYLERLEAENERLQAVIGDEHCMVGESPRMRDAYRFIAKVAPTDATVLIRGESGTGKELAARAIHRHSPRAEKPFVAVNCAALTETLLESELFGHEKGAFTGAFAQKKGRLEMADGGTLFLDEVGELSPAIQAKLLRFLQERKFERVGGTLPLKVDLRILAATNRDLEESIKSGGFRQDLYYRLNVIPFVMPPLRERPEDIPLLAHYFTAKYARKCNRRVTGLSVEARRCLTEYSWPGNVRELENAIERAVVLGSTEQVLAEDLPDAVLEVASAAGRSPASYYELLREAKKQIVLNAFAQAGGHHEAAQLLGLHPNNLHRLIRNLNLKSSLRK